MYTPRLIDPYQIMMGVHGNGLTSLVWMRPTPRATVIEFFVPVTKLHPNIRTEEVGFVDSIRYVEPGDSCGEKA